MKKIRINPSKLVITTIILWAFIISAIVSPGFFGDTILFAVLPLLIPIAILLSIPTIKILILGSSVEGRTELQSKGASIWKKPIGEVFQPNGKLAHTISILYLLALVIGSWAIIRSYQYLPLSEGAPLPFVLQNTGRALVIAQFLLVISLSALQADVYWWLHKKSTRLDERQEFVRRRILETSYKFAVVIVGAFVWLLVANKNWVAERQNGLYSSSDLDWIPIGLVLLLFALPSIIAAWQKDS